MDRLRLDGQSRDRGTSQAERQGGATPGLPETVPTGRVLAWPNRRPSPYFSILERAFAGIDQQLSSVLSEGHSARRLYQQLIDLEPAQRRLVIRNTQRYYRIEICDALLRNSLLVAPDTPALALELAELAVELAEGIPSGTYPEGLVRDVLARAWAHLGNAQRALCRFEAADRAFSIAEHLLSRGSGDPLEEAQILVLRAFLAGDRGQLDTAEELLDREIRLYQESGQVQLMGRVLLHKASTRARRGERDDAIELCREGLALIDRHHDDQLALTGRRYLLHFLEAAGRQHEALALLSRTRKLSDAHSQDWVRLQIRWLAGKLALAEGRWAEARDSFAEAFDGFLRRRELREAIGVVLDLADLRLKERPTGKPTRLAERLSALFPMLPPCSALRDGVEALHQAVLSGRLNGPTLQTVARRIDDLGTDPDLYASRIS